MSTSLSIGQSSLSIGWNFSKTNAWNANTSNSSVYSYSGALNPGTGAGNAQRILVDQVAIASGATQTYTLDSYTDMFGQTAQAMTIVRLIYVNGISSASTAPTAGAEVSGTMMQVTSNSGGVIQATTTSGKINMGPLGALFMERTDSTGWTVTASTGNTFTIKNLDANTQTFNVLIVGQ